MRKLYNICDLLVECEFYFETMLRRSRQYELTQEAMSNREKKEPDIVLKIKKEEIEKYQEKYPYLSLEECEVMLSGSEFYYKLLSFNGFMLHASAVVMDGKAYLFSAPSGTGKSTHTSLWLDAFADHAYILNDDKPAILLREDGIYACGTPWSGKSDLNTNNICPLQGICVLSRSLVNHIEQLDNQEAVYAILNQTIRPKEAEKMLPLLDGIDRLISNVPIWQMGCNISTEAAQMAYEAMRNI